MARIGGGGGMTLSARFPVDADLSPFQAQVDEAVMNALVRFDIVRKQENEKYDSLVSKLKQKSDVARQKEVDYNDDVIQNFLAESEKTRTKMTTLGKMALRHLVSETMQTFNLIGQVSGFGKNQTYQLIMGMVTGVTGMISTMTLAASSAVAMYGPIVGPAIAAWNVANSVAAFSIQTMLNVNAAQIQNNNGDLGNTLVGGDFVS